MVRQFQLGDRVTIARADLTSQARGTVCGTKSWLLPTTIQEAGKEPMPQLPVRLDEPFWDITRTFYVSVLLVHPDNLAHLED